MRHGHVESTKLVVEGTGPFGLAKKIWNKIMCADMRLLGIGPRFPEPNEMESLRTGRHRAKPP